MFKRKYDTQFGDLFGFFNRNGLRHFVFRHSVCVESAGQRFFVENRYCVTKPRQKSRARKPGGTGTDDGDGFSVRRARLINFSPRIHRVIGRVTLQSADFNRFVHQSFLDARAFAQNFDRTNSRARRTNRIGVKNHARRTKQISRRDFFDKRRHVNMRRTRVNARRVDSNKDTDSPRKPLPLATSPD